MRSIILFAAFAPFAAAITTDLGLRNGFAAVSPSPAPSHTPPDPAFTFTLSCDKWRLEYLVEEGELSLWTSCYARKPDPWNSASPLSTLTSSLPKGEDVYAISRLALDISYVANEYAIHAASPSNSAPVSFSSLCHNCTLYNETSSIMTCNCTTNDGHPPMSVDLGLSIAGMDNGVPCFTDGIVCAVQQSASTMTVSAATKSSSSAQHETCTSDSSPLSVSTTPTTSSAPPTTLTTTTSPVTPTCTEES